MTNPRIDEFGTKAWYNTQGQLHREDGPAIEFTRGDKYWAINGWWHREDGPAWEGADGTKEWYIKAELIN